MKLRKEFYNQSLACLYTLNNRLSAAQTCSLNSKINAFKSLEEKKSCIADFALGCDISLTALDTAKQKLDSYRKANINILSILCQNYPACLIDSNDTPLLLFGLGNTEILSDSFQGIAIVGTRNATKAASRLTLSISSQLSAYGFCIVSGIARGIDAAAHLGALIPAEGKTIAVLGSGLHYRYPRSNEALYSKILERQGLLISQFSPERGPRPYQFLQRNYLIAGLSQSGIIVRAAKRSGALVTARALLETGRDVFSVPGDPCDPLSYGSNQLIKDGAIPITSADDVINYSVL